MEDFYTGDDLDCILAVIEDDLLEKNEEITGEVNNVVGEIVDIPPDKWFHCDQCDEVCKTTRGLTRHINAKHKTELKEDHEGNNPITAESILHPLYLKKYINASALKLSADECYSESTRMKFTNYVVNLDDANYTYHFVRNIIRDFHGDGEKFYPDFYKCVLDEIIFKNLSRRASVFSWF